MAKERQKYADIELDLDRDDKGNILTMRYTINGAGQDRKNIIDFIEMLSLLCHNTEETNRIAEELNREKI